mgnify:CR=1 FL=1
MSNIMLSVVRIIGMSALVGGSAGGRVAGPIGTLLGVAVGAAGGAVLLTTLVMLTGAVAIVEDVRKPDK